VNSSKFPDAICRAAPAIATLRRDLHAHPELRFEEHRTSARVAQELAQCGITVHRGIGKTGVVGVLRRGTSPRAIGLRADMDALPITESNTFEHASVHPGKMHACGHDGHTAMLLSAAQYLAQHGEFDGTVYFIFQPAEEGSGGAAAMIQDGLFTRFPMDAIFGVHNWPGLPAGKFAVRPGPMLASASRFKLKIRGQGAHAAMPNDGVDPVLIGCQVVQAFQSIITRNKRPMDPAVLSVTMIHAGDTVNVIPDTCELKGVVRTFTNTLRDLIEARLREVSSHTCGAFGATCDLEFDPYCPATINSPEETASVVEVLTELVGSANVVDFEGTMGAEDFSCYLLEKPGCYWLIGNGDGDHRAVDHGAGSCWLHSASYDFNDELIPLGGSMWSRLVEKCLLSGPTAAMRPSVITMTPFSICSPVAVSTVAPTIAVVCEGRGRYVLG
jgi:amidohydrolase